MKHLFKNVLLFTIFYFLVLAIDIYIKISFEPYTYTYRYFTKAILLLSLGIFYYYNKNKDTPKNKNRLVYIALFVFLIGDMFLLNYVLQPLYITGLILFLIGKLLYAARFSNQNDFKLTKLLPFLGACFLYMIVIMLLVYDTIGAFFIPALLYLFSCMIVALFAFLRKGVVDRFSYTMVMVGILCSMVSDTFGVLQSFYDENIFSHEFSTMFFYGTSQFLIVVGLAKEKIISRSYFFIK
ncbi:lysoplasmalogenase family protein [Lacinutrix salivirga]